MKPGAFFHEPAHFELLARTVLPGLADRRAVQLWSAGCGAGEAAWSLAMLVAEALPPHVEVTILATDRDPELLARAAAAVYRDDEMHQVSDDRRARHFVRGEGTRRGLWRVVAPLRDLVEFAELDLGESWPDRGAFDIVVCHDAPARLDARTAAHLVGRFGDVLAPGGVMLLGPSEGPNDELPRLEPYGRAAYRKIA